MRAVQENKDARCGDSALPFANSLPCTFYRFPDVGRRSGTQRVPKPTLSLKGVSDPSQPSPERPPQLPWKRGRSGRSPGGDSSPQGPPRSRPRPVRRRAPPPAEAPHVPDHRLAAAAAGAGPGTGRWIQDGGRQEAASSGVGGKGESAAATPGRPRPFLAGGSGGHWSLLTGGRTGAAKGGGGTTVYLRSPGLHLLAPLLFVHLLSGFLAGRPRGDGPTRRRLRSIYTPSPSPSPATTVTQTWARPSGPATNWGPRSCPRARALS